jgi:hypothetical protein
LAVSPYRLRGIDLIDARLTQVVALAALCALSVSKGVKLAPYAAALMLVLAVRAGVVSYQFAHGHAVYTQLRKDMAALPERCLLIGATSPDSVQLAQGYWMPPMHLAFSLAILDGKPYISTIFLEKASHPLWYSDLGGKLSFRSDVPADVSDKAAFWTSAKERYSLLRERNAAIAEWPVFVVYIKGRSEDVAGFGLPVEFLREKYAILRLL